MSVKKSLSTIYQNVINSRSFYMQTTKLLIFSERSNGKYNCLQKSQRKFCFVNSDNQNNQQKVLKNFCF